ncbi:MAG: NADH-quinone oxidoreductase subunit J [Syntrophorhabdaceae bacterium]|nr:NADH-quinone oxidoreductase subunit J [Syntrophorhabdaceae bacterium]MDD4197187.1 NADH-quinone oxidoreductase subunit J [Syntrophorhabdaceae bacterium]HOC45272.1 NADH-quinone oxidoreductase subunit J [Syntrophorhabdaceae bacterium]
MIGIGLGFKWFIFVVMALTAVGASIIMVTRKNPIHSALWLIVTFFSIAVLYVTLNATFIAVAQVMVYAGAVMMLVIFVIMLIHLEWGARLGHKKSFPKLIGSIITIILFLQILAGVYTYSNTGQHGIYTAQKLAEIGNTRAVGTVLYGKYAFAFEIASILLLVGIVGAVLLARKRKEQER